jgi:hypothetical protein
VSKINLNILKLYCALFILIQVSCSPTKKLKQGEYLVNKNKIENVKETKLKSEDIEAFVRQKPNRKFLGKIHFYVWWFNLFDDEKIQRKKEEQNTIK